MRVEGEVSEEEAERSGRREGDEEVVVPGLPEVVETPASDSVVDKPRAGVRAACADLCNVGEPGNGAMGELPAVSPRSLQPQHRTVPLINRAQV